MSEAVDILLKNVDRILSAENADDTITAMLETEAFQGTLEVYIRRNRLAQVELNVFRQYLADFTERFYPKI